MARQIAVLTASVYLYRQGIESMITAIAISIAIIIAGNLIAVIKYGSRDVLQIMRSIPQNLLSKKSE